MEYPEHYLKHYLDIFSEEEFDKLPPCRPWDQCIELIADFKPVNCKIHALTLDEQKALDIFLEENLWSGRIQPLNFLMTLPFFFIKKADGTLRPVQDYQKLNDFIIKNRYPLPFI